MAKQIIEDSDRWLEEEAPRFNVVISSRSRLARNLQKYRFAPYASKEELQAVALAIEEAIKKIHANNEFIRLAIPNLKDIERLYLMECRQISKEFGATPDERYVYLSKDRRISIMVNEEDHIRMQCILPGLQVNTTFEIINVIDNQLNEYLEYAYSEKYGFLTACPTNTGTGLRVSVMMHLPALSIQEKIKDIIEMVQPLGFAIRGFEGENSRFHGDFYQISNDITLGKTEESIVESLMNVINDIVTKEEEARASLFKEHPESMEDTIWRSFALLKYARRIESSEAMQLLSRIRLGIDGGLFPSLSHRELNRLFLAIQPAHIQMQNLGDTSASSRDANRAHLLRERLDAILSTN